MLHFKTYICMCTWMRRCDRKACKNGRPARVPALGARCVCWPRGHSTDGGCGLHITPCDGKCHLWFWDSSSGCLYYSYFGFKPWSVQMLRSHTHTFSALPGPPLATCPLLEKSRCFFLSVYLHVCLLFSVCFLTCHLTILKRNIIE